MLGIKLQTFQKHGVSHRGNPREDHRDKDSLLYCLNFYTGKYKISLTKQTMTLGLSVWDAEGKCRNLQRMCIVPLVIIQFMILFIQSYVCICKQNPLNNPINPSAITSD